MAALSSSSPPVVPDQRDDPEPSLATLPRSNQHVARMFGRPSHAAWEAPLEPLFVFRLAPGFSSRSTRPLRTRPTGASSRCGRAPIAICLSGPRHSVASRDEGGQPERRAERGGLRALVMTKSTAQRKRSASTSAS